MDPQLLQTLIITIKQFNVTDYAKVALITLFTADFLHTVIDEINFVWFTPWTFFKIVFFFCRYSPFIDASAAIAAIVARSPSAQACVQIARINLWCAGLGQMSSHVILIIRVYALCGPSRRNAIVFTLFGAATFASAITLMAVGNQTTSAAIPSPVPGLLPNCITTSISSVANVYSILGIIVSVINETVLFIVICWVRFRKYRHERNKLIRRIYGDALVYYLISFAISVSGITVWFASSGPILDLSARVPRFLLSIVACRVVLHIREYGNDGNCSGDDIKALPTTNVNATHQTSQLQFRNSMGTESTVVDEER